MEAHLKIPWPYRRPPDLYRSLENIQYDQSVRVKVYRRE